MRVWPIIRNVPFIGILAVIYLIVAASDRATIDAGLFEMGLPSGAVWQFSVHHLFMVLGLILLYVEIAKATRTTRVAIGDHALSLAVFIICMILFLLVEIAGTSTFLLITLLELVDVVAGFTVTIAGARRDLGYDPMGIHHPPP